MEHKLKDGRIIELRDVKVSDAILLLDFFELVNTETENLMREPEEYTFSVNDERKFIRRVIQSTHEHLIVAVLDGEIIGTIGIRNRNLRRVEHRVALGMSVLKKFNNLGLGTMMLNRIIEDAKGARKLKMELEVRADNLSAIHLYEKFGFKLEGTITNGFYVNNKFVDLLFMGKWL